MFSIVITVFSVKQQSGILKYEQVDSCFTDNKFITSTSLNIKTLTPNIELNNITHHYICIQLWHQRQTLFQQ